MCQHEDLQSRPASAATTTGYQSNSSLEKAVEGDTDCTSVSDTESESEISMDTQKGVCPESSFNALRLNYLFVILSIMLADGLQGKQAIVLC